MTDKQIEKAEEYAKNYPIPPFFTPDAANTVHVIAKSSYMQGAQDALTSQWVSVEEWLPEDDTMVTAHSPNGRIDVLKYHDGEFIDELGQAHRVDYFIPIPQLNPEKEER